MAGLSFLRDVLPFTIKLPEAIASAKTQKELEEVAQLGAGIFIYYFTPHLEWPRWRFSKFDPQMNSPLIKA